MNTQTLGELKAYASMNYLSRKRIDWISIHLGAELSRFSTNTQLAEKTNLHLRAPVFWVDGRCRVTLNRSFITEIENGNNSSL